MTNGAVRPQTGLCSSARDVVLRALSDWHGGCIAYGMRIKDLLNRPGFYVNALWPYPGETDDAYEVANGRVYRLGTLVSTMPVQTTGWVTERDRRLMYHTPRLLFRVEDVTEWAKSSNRRVRPVEDAYDRNLSVKQNLA